MADAIDDVSVDIDEDSFEIVNDDDLLEFDMEEKPDINMDIIQMVTKMLLQIQSDIDNIKNDPNTFDHKFYEDYITLVSEYDFVISKHPTLKLLTKLLKMDLDACEQASSKIKIQEIIEQDNKELFAQYSVDYNKVSYPIKNVFPDSQLDTKQQADANYQFVCSKLYEIFFATENKILTSPLIENYSDQFITIMDTHHEMISNSDLLTKMVMQIRSNFYIISIKYENEISANGVLIDKIDKINKKYKIGSIKTELTFENVISDLNKLLEESDQPTTLDKDDFYERCGTILLSYANMIELYPQLKSVTDKICDNLNKKYKRESQDDPYIFDINANYIITNKKLGDLKNKISASHDCPELVIEIYGEIDMLMSTYSDTISKSPYLTGLVSNIMNTIGCREQIEI